MHAIEQLRVDATYLATFAEPAFGFLRWTDIYAVIFRRFAPWVQPEAIRWEGQSSQPADLLIVCNLLALNAAVRFRLMNAETWIGNPEVPGDPSLWSDLVGRTASVVRDMQPEAAFSSHSFSLAVHWKSPATFAGELERWTREGPNGFKASGVSFVAESSNGSRTTVQLQPSRLFPDGAGWAHVTREFPGSISPEATCGQAVTEIGEALRSLGLGLELTK